MHIQDKENQFSTKNISIPDDQNFIILVGGNNSGKSTFLRTVIKTIGTGESYHVSVNRTVLTGEAPMKREDYERDHEMYTQQMLRQKDDNNHRLTQPLQDFFTLKNFARKPIVDWYNAHFPNQLVEEREDPENSASSMLLKVGGHSITKQGSGMRATLEIFIKLFDPNIKVLCIDEPELGLEPSLQKYLFQALKEKSCEDKKIILATHSHHFIDTVDQANNFICSRNSDDKISLQPVKNLPEVIFGLLGNTLSSFLLPERVLIFEGPSDTLFLTKCLELLGKTGYGIHNSGGNGDIGYAIHSITHFLTFNKNNLPVYKERIFVIVDNPKKDTLVRKWKKLLENEDRLLVLDKDAIEYYYPEHILQSVFETEDCREEIVQGYLKSDPNSYNKKQFSKKELATRVCEKISTSDLKENKNNLTTFLKELPN